MTMTVMSLAEQFLNRFAALTRCHGETMLKEGVPDGRGKVPSRSHLEHTPPTAELWQQHLDGTLGIGLCPIRDDGTVRWGAIDLDAPKGGNYTDIEKNFAKIEGKINELEIPLILCRTKSGGAHLYLFCSEDVTAELVRKKLMEWAVALGFSGVEVFPKQTRLASKNDYGNWINMPYSGTLIGDSPRHGIVNGRPITAEQFLKLAEGLAVSSSELTRLSIKQDSKFADLLHEAPPCLQCLAQQGGIQEGGRNNGLYNIAVYLRKRFGDDEFKEHVDKYNQALIATPLGHKEVSQLTRSVGKKAYEYKCNEDPIQPVCNRQICLTRKYGVGRTDESDPGVVFGALVKLTTDPVTWIWDVDGARIELTTDELKDQARFHRKCMDVLNKWPFTLKPQAWSALIREQLKTVEIQQVPEESTPDGIIWSYLETYCTGITLGKRPQDLVTGRPYRYDGSSNGDETVEAPKGFVAGRVYFNLRFFHRWLKQERILVSERQLTLLLTNKKATHLSINIKGKFINLWSVPAFSAQNEKFDDINPDGDF